MGMIKTYDSPRFIKIYTCKLGNDPQPYTFQHTGDAESALNYVKELHPKSEIHDFHFVKYQSIDSALNKYSMSALGN